MGLKPVVSVNFNNLRMYLKYNIHQGRKDTVLIDRDFSTIGNKTEEKQSQRILVNK